MNFLNYYNHPKNVRFKSFEFALQEAENRNHKLLVETGTARGRKKKYFFWYKENWTDGMSSMIFSDYAKYIKGHLYTCDIDEQNIKNAKKFTKKNKPFITFIKDDSVNFLKNFKQKIDFLYLDSLDGHLPNASDHQLNEIKNSINLLTNNSLVLLDDKGSKTNLSSQFLLKNNYKIINETDQQLLLSL